MKIPPLHGETSAGSIARHSGWVVITRRVGAIVAPLPTVTLLGAAGCSGRNQWRKA